MQSIELSPARFSPQQINEQQQELQEKISLLLDTVAVDEVTILFFLEESEREIDPQTEFFLIIQKPRPSSKHAQFSTLERLAYCFYSLSLQQREDFQIMESAFQKYLRKSSFPSPFVEIHQQVRKWGSELRFYKTLNGHKIKLEKIREQMNEKEKRLDLLRWRVQLCLLLFDIILIKQKAQRATIAKILRQFKNLKKENKINTKPTLQAFSFLVNHLISTSNDAYILFEREIHIWSQQIVDNTLICQMKALIQKCQLHSINHLKNKTTTNIQTNRIARGIAKPKMQTLIISNEINSRLYQPSSNRAEKMLKKRPSRQKEETFMKQINHFLKTREGRSFRSLENTQRSNSREKEKIKISIKISNHRSSSSTHYQNQQFSSFTAPVTASSYLKPITMKEQSIILQTLSASKSGGSFYRMKGTRKRKQMYEKIVEKEISKSLISSKYLRDEMFSLTQVEQQRCNITLQEILIGQYGKQVEQPLLKFVGAIEDIQFGILNLSYLTIFNQQLAQLNFQLRKNNKNLYIVQAKVRSTYCTHTALFRVGKNSKTQFTIQQLNQSIVGSSIYYQALQERIQRKIGISQLQAMQELFYRYLRSQLSQNQLNKLLLCVDLLESEFFWYYTKSNYLSGTRLEKRNTMDFYDLSAFAVSLGKFKADFDSCLDEIVVVENDKSLIETCVYLSHGRKIVYKALRKIKGSYFLQYLEATSSVYRSFFRKGKTPYFANTTLYRNMILLRLFSKVLDQAETEADFNCNQLKIKKSFDLQQIFKEEDIFVFLMKNIVENFIQIKYLRRLQKKLMDLNKKEDYEIFDDRLVQCILKFKQDVVYSDNEVSDETNFKPSIHSSMRNIRQNIISYCDAYKIGMNLLIAKKQIHLLYLDGNFYCVQEIILVNGIRVIKASKKANRSTYILFFCHQPFSELSILPSPFHKRLALKHKNYLLGNLVRKNQPQPLLCLDLIPVCKQLLRLPQGQYCYACASQCLSLLGWRLDLYFPGSQTHFATYLDEQIFLQWLSGQTQQQVWSGLLKMMNISQSLRTIQLQNRRLQLFRCLRSLVYSETKAEGSLQLIQLDGQLQYLLCNFEGNILSIGKVESIMFLNSKSIFNSTEKESLQSYQNILNFLYYKITHAKLPAETISLDYFIIQSDFCSSLLSCNNCFYKCPSSNSAGSKKPQEGNKRSIFSIFFLIRFQKSNVDYT